MKVLKSLTKGQIRTILGIAFLTIFSLWIYEYVGHAIQEESYIKVVEENELLKVEIDNLKEQNQLLNRVLELKQNLE